MNRLAVIVALVVAAGVAAGVVLTLPDEPAPETTAGPTVTPVSTPTPAAATTPTATPTATPTPTRTPTPEPVDPDADRLPSRLERELGTDPRHKTMLVTVLYDDDARRLTDLEREEMRAHFAAMDVPNPDGRTGITLRFTGNATANGSIRVDEATLRSLRLSYVDNETIARPCVEHLLGIGAADSRVAGLAPAPGYVALSGANYDGRTRTKVMTHELLHNVAGTLDADHEKVASDGVHTTLGWLSHGTAYRTLSEPTARKLRTAGLSAPRYCS
jgi:hypothetical protein